MKKSFMVIWPALSGLALLFDRLTKWFFVQNPTEHISVWEPYVYLEYHLNTQLALSLPLINWVYYPLLVVVIIALSVAFIKAIREKKTTDTLLTTLILIGAFSNLADRILYQGVVDFVAISFWSVFNLADVYIVGGVLFWIVILWNRDMKKKS